MPPFISEVYELDWRCSSEAESLPSYVNSGHCTKGEKSSEKSSERAQSPEEEERA